MELANGPNDRRRVDAETQRKRDAEVAGMRRAGVPFRTIAERLNMSLGAVQKALRRSQNLAAVYPAAVDDVVYSPDEWPKAATTPPVGDGWQVLNPVERWRYAMQTGRRDIPIHDDDHRRCCLAYGIDPNWRPDMGGSASHRWPQENEW